METQSVPAITMPAVFTTEVVVTGEARDLMSTLRGRAEIAATLVVDSVDTGGKALEEMRALAAAAKRLKELKAAAVQPAKDRIAEASLVFDEVIDLTATAVDKLKRAIAAYDARERARVAEEQRKAREAEAERQRKIEEARIKAEEMRRQAQPLPENDPIAAVRAAQLRKQVEQEAEMEMEAQVPVVIEPPRTVGGVHTRSKWVAKVTDMKAFLGAIAEREEYHSCVELNQGQLNKLAGAFRLTLKIPGVEVVEEKVAVAR